LAPEQPSVWAARLQFLADSNRTDEAQQVLDKVGVQFADTPGILAVFYLAMGREDEAAEQFKADLAKWPDNVPLIRRATEFCQRSDRPQMAKEMLAAIAIGRTPAPPSDVVWARRTFALALLNEGRQADRDVALGLVDENLKTNPQSVLDLRTKAMILDASPDMASRQQAREILERLVESNRLGRLETRQRLAEMYLRDRVYANDAEWTKAVRLLRDADDPASLTVYVEGLLHRGQLAEAQVAWNRLAQLAPNQWSTAALQAELLYRQGRPSEILGVDGETGIFEKFLAVEVTSDIDAGKRASVAAACERYAQQLTQVGSSDLAEKFASNAEVRRRELATRGVNERLALAAFLGRQQRFDEAFAIAEQSLPDAQPQPAAALLAELTVVCTRLDPMLNRIDTLLQAAVDRHGQSIELMSAGVELRIRQERFDDLEALLREMLKIQPDSPQLQNNLAELLALRNRNQQELQEAAQLIDKAIEQSGAVAALLDTRGMVRLALGDRAGAIANFKEAVSQQPTGNRLFHLALAYEKSGQSQRDAAITAWKAAGKQNVTENQIHPLERSEFHRLAEVLQ
jgi:tetratricopeptide (TPR) repeat protein